MEYLDGIPVYEVFGLIVADWEATLTPLLAGIKTSLQSDQQSYAVHYTQQLTKEGWLRIRAMMGVVDCILGLVCRLWSRYFRHCDMHGGNIMALLESVEVGSAYFHALLLKGRGFAPVDLKGYHLSDIRDLSKTLRDNEIMKATFIVFHPRRLRFIDLSYLINIKELTKTIPDLSGPCRTGSADRQEDSFELSRLWVLLNHKVKAMNDTWHRLSGANQFDSMQSNPSFKPTIDEVARQVSGMIEMVEQIYKEVFEDNKEWSDCQKYVQSYLRERKKVSVEDHEQLRLNWNKISQYECTVEQEMNGLKVAQTRLFQLGKKLEEHLPNGFTHSVVGPNLWPSCPPLPDHVTGLRLSESLSLSKSAGFT